MKNKLIGLFAESPIHAGAGHSTGVIDLPIMREAHTYYPCIFGSAFKGALRSKAVNHWKTCGNKKPLIKNIFGTESSESNSWGGALMPSDMLLLLMPIRSLTTHFKLVTCPYILQRWQRDMKRINNAKFKLPEQIKTFRNDDSETCYVVSDDKNPIYLEEFKYTPQTLNNADELLQALNALTPEEYDVIEQLCIVSNDQFNHLSTIGTSVTPHISIENETKTAKAGALWYEETLPTDTLFYAILGIEDSHNQSTQLTANNILDEVNALFTDSPYIQVGGNETLGMGWMQIIPQIKPEESKAWQPNPFNNSVQNTLSTPSTIG